MKENKSSKKFKPNLKLILIGFIIGVVFYSIRKKSTNTVQLKIEEKTYTLEIADSNIERSVGLMHRKSLPNNRGMLFIFPQERKHSFWMYQTKIPLDILWLDKNWNVIHVERNVPPCKSDNPSQCESYKPDEKAKYVIELPASKNID